MPLAIPILKSLSSTVLSSWILHLPYKSVTHTKSDQCQNLGSIGLAKKFMRVFLGHLTDCFTEQTSWPTLYVCVYIYPLCVCIYIYIYIVYMQVGR